MLVRLLPLGFFLLGGCHLLLPVGPSPAGDRGKDAVFDRSGPHDRAGERPVAAETQPMTDRRSVADRGDLGLPGDLGTDLAALSTSAGASGGAPWMHDHKAAGLLVVLVAASGPTPAVSYNGKALQMTCQLTAKVKPVTACVGVGSNADVGLHPIAVQGATGWRGHAWSWSGVTATPYQALNTLPPGSNAAYIWVASGSSPGDHFLDVAVAEETTGFVPSAPAHVPIDVGTTPISFAFGQLIVAASGPVTVSWTTSPPANVQWAIAAVRLRAGP